MEFYSVCVGFFAGVFASYLVSDLVFENFKKEKNGKEDD